MSVYVTHMVQKYFLLKFPLKKNYPKINIEITRSFWDSLQDTGCPGCPGLDRFLSSPFANFTAFFVILAQWDNGSFFLLAAGAVRGFKYRCNFTAARTKHGNAAQSRAARRGDNNSHYKPRVHGRLKRLVNGTSLLPKPTGGPILSVVISPYRRHARTFRNIFTGWKAIEISRDEEKLGSKS